MCPYHTAQLVGKNELTAEGALDVVRFIPAPGCRIASIDLSANELGHNGLAGIAAAVVAAVPSCALRELLTVECKLVSEVVVYLVARLVKLPEIAAFDFTAKNVPCNVAIRISGVLDPGVADRSRGGDDDDNDEDYDDVKGQCDGTEDGDDDEIEADDEDVGSSGLDSGRITLTGRKLDRIQIALQPLVTEGSTPTGRNVNSV